MSNEQPAGSAVGETAPSRNWSLLIGRLLLMWALVEAALSGLANLSGGSLLGVAAQHYSLDGIIAALVGIGFVIDGSARPLRRGKPE